MLYIYYHDSNWFEGVGCNSNEWITRICCSSHHICGVSNMEVRILATYPGCFTKRSRRRWTPSEGWLRVFPDKTPKFYVQSKPMTNKLNRPASLILVSGQCFWSVGSPMHMPVTTWPHPQSPWLFSSPGCHCPESRMPLSRRDGLSRSQCELVGGIGRSSFEGHRKPKDVRTALERRIIGFLSFCCLAVFILKFHLLLNYGFNAKQTCCVTSRRIAEKAGSCWKCTERLAWMELRSHLPKSCNSHVTCRLSICI